MHLVKPSYEIWSNNLPAIQRIERAGRVCYKSEDKITVTSGEPFCRKLLNVLKHESVFEHVSLGASSNGRTIYSAATLAPQANRFAGISGSFTLHCKPGPLCNFRQYPGLA